ncbi:type II toxin-antitoxin system RelE/ParE family toxin [Parabacteroides acidifaciens]|uniref:Type II toxin-antitoxin system RelE/ParE family toxin n=1 Tax=Parabacteroides acidifaciens TaxID=2290935 RepID=A0A3D8HGE2_9BACT|nr:MULTISPECIES: type II toxin-antitoxin system RelE/ParE family toxin [Parabacteroides]MBC8601290.1 type II toxin-antitoxin system RelE/ParE family toxin [Parabacteroides acidifaciens]RDU49971.1 type II toxin-antitoxin system RelE/ParE family toxin [Parabacteroides acidifaciens]RHR52629.1 type II toxin-antitoxin system RelE/ParE family toxin [Parabacteroides sp. AF17-28]
MEYNLVITPKAQKSIDDVCDKVLNAWGIKCYNNLIDELERCFNIIQDYPFAFQANIRYPEIRQCVVTPLNILYYEIEEHDIIILAFEDTRMDPDKVTF